MQPGYAYTVAPGAAMHAVQQAMVSGARVIVCATNVAETAPLVSQEGTEMGGALCRCDPTGVPSLVKQLMAHLQKVGKPQERTTLVFDVDALNQIPIRTVWTLTGWLLQLQASVLVVTEGPLSSSCLTMNHKKLLNGCRKWSAPKASVRGPG